MYSITTYGFMITDTVRMSAYDAALRKAVKPGSVVVDIGTGTGIFALLACKYGASRVYAIEPASAIQLAREMAQVNGFADRITFLQTESTKITLPEQVDVCVSDLHGMLPFFNGNITSVVDARKR